MADMGAALTGADKRVVTGGNQPLDWANSARLDDIAAVRALKASDGPDLLIQGSSTLYPPLLAAGLGTEKRLFGHGTLPTSAHPEPVTSRPEHERQRRMQHGTW
jgi:dihydrofolate reductase